MEAGVMATRRQKGMLFGDFHWFIHSVVSLV
jgi:hypothetical protein